MRNLLVTNCKYCGKEIRYWASENRQFCNRLCDAAYKKGRSVGTYSDYQVNAMVSGKRNAYLARVLEMEKNGKYNIERIKYILKYVPISNTRQLAKILGFNESKDGCSTTKELKYLLDYYDLTKMLKKQQYPECYTVAQPEQLIWLDSILQKCSNYYEFQSLFKEGYKEIGIRNSAAKYKNLILYVQYNNIKTAALREDLSKNLKQCGTSCEVKMRNILDALNCKYSEQVYIPYKEYQIEGESKTRWHKLKPDFIVDEKFIIEVNGDYWHAYNVPIDKMTSDQRKRTSHDIEKYDFYNKMNYRFIVIWEHELANISYIENLVKQELENEWNYKTIIYN